MARVVALAILAAAVRTTAGAACTVGFLRLRGGSADPVQLVNGAGELLPASATAVASAVSSGSLSLVASVGGKSRAAKLLNAVFGTTFPSKLQLGAVDASAAGAWLAASSSMPGCLVLETRPLASTGQQRSAVDGAKLTTFSLALADAILVHSPAVTPTLALVKESYERIFSQHLAAMPSGSDGRTMIVHVRDPEDRLSEAAVRAACKDAWNAAAAVTEFKGKAFSDLFEWSLVTVPADADDADGFAEGVEALRATLSGVGGKLGKPAAFADVASAAWEASGSVFDAQPSDVWLTERYLAARSYEAAYTEAQILLRRWTGQVAKGKIVAGFGPEATALLTSALAAFDAGVSTCSATSSAMISQRRTRLSKALQNDIQELFAKQHRQLTTATVNRFKAQLLKVMGRGGTVAEWQQEGLRRNAEKQFDAAVGQLLVDGVGDQTRAQLTSSFGKQLTEITAKFLDSPPMQLQAISAMRRRTGKAQKPPRGVRAGVGLVGALRNTFGGGQGNMQTYAGYVDGLNSLHLMYANDGAIVDSSGAEPPLFRWQPKVNFDVSV